ncbi:MAG: cysteine--tRNA ligase [Clostridia bacterium]|nr:cysteine--tRNA ligase [Clostridia bacterium]
MKFYNSLTKQVQEFKPRDENQVSIYTCGPTVYHFAHIGNLRNYIMQDILVKALKFGGYNVKRVMNITDVGHLSDDGDYGEDKMIEGAKRENKTVEEIAKFYTDAYFSDMKKVNNAMPDVVEPATNCIDEFINAVQTLLDKGFAYQAGGNIYFDTSKLESYHKFFNFKQEDLEVGVRSDVELDESKRNANDFVLWFTKSKFEDQAQKWESPWGLGYPGWHIECSCIAIKHLGEYLDIHCGGIDNAFPHHTNEIAQSEAILGHEWCPYWLHVMHLNTKSGKMSKSSGGFLTLSVLEEEGFNPLAYRFFCLLSHYRKNLVFDYESLENAQTAYNKLLQKIAKIEEVGDIQTDKVQEYKAKFLENLNNDLNTSLVITGVYDLLKDNDVNGNTKRQILAQIDEVLSLDLLKPIETQSDVPAEVQALAEKRWAAKQARDFATADAIRAQIDALGFVVVDKKDGFTLEIK